MRFLSVLNTFQTNATFSEVFDNGRTSPFRKSCREENDFVDLSFFFLQFNGHLTFMEDLRVSESNKVNIRTEPSLDQVRIHVPHQLQLHEEYH